MAKGDPILRALGQRIKEARKARGISQTDLARILDVTRSAVSQWESGIFAPAMEKLLALAGELRVALEWLATARGERNPPEPNLRLEAQRVRLVPLLSWISAGQLIDAESQIPAEDVPLLAFADLGRGDFFALKVKGDSMNRVSPDGSTIVINRNDKNLAPSKPYVFWHRTEGTTFKLWRPDPDRLVPHSWNDANQTIFIKRKNDFAVLGRVKRTVLDL